MNANMLLSWTVHSTLAVSVVYLISFYFGMGDRGSFINAMLALMMLVSYVILRMYNHRYSWIMTGMATIFTVISVGTGLSLSAILRETSSTASSEWQLVRGAIAGLSLAVSAAIAFFFSQNAGLAAGLKRSRVLLVYCVQAAVLNTTFRYGPLLLPKLFGS